MKLEFKEIIIHNFLSINHAIVKLDDRGYIIVEGHNNNKADNALSNGSGKSSIFNAICWCLTGETLQGLKTNIPNIKGEGGCFVELSFLCDGDQYKVTRYRDHKKFKNDLHIIINDEDKSGKGLRGSEQLLQTYLPDITPKLIGSVIIFGQGLPYRFSDNTPSGRKEVLEQLSKSDFMIQDIKDRIAKRSNELTESLRLEEDNKLRTESQLKVYKDQLEANKEALSKLEEEYNESYKDEIENKKAQIKELDANIESKTKKHDELDVEIKSKQAFLDEMYAEFSSLSEGVDNKYKDKIEEARNNNVNKRVEIYNLKSEIDRLDSITDICPTCGQKLPDVNKIDTSDMKKQLDKLNRDLANLEDISNKLEAKRDEELKKSKEELSGKGEALNKEIREATSLQKLCHSDIINMVQHKGLIENEINNTINMLAAYEAKKKTLLDNEKEFTRHTAALEDLLARLDKDLENINDHISVVNKINTLIKRDFRGLLLKNIIDYINKKAKEYCAVVFNTDDLNLELDGNNLNIIFCNKSLENLSGGERQRINIILQFAIREMMCKYLGFSSNILVLDEIFDNLDKVSCDAILNLIDYVGKDIASVFVISHHSDELDIPYDDVLSIVKDENGVSSVV